MRAFDEQIEALRREEEARKTPEERAAEALLAEAVAEEDAALFADHFGVSKRPNGEWLSADEHRRRATEMHDRATNMLDAAAVQVTRTSRTQATAVAPSASRARPQRAREPRRQPSRRRGGHRARAPGDDSDPEPPAAATRRCEGCGADITQRRHDARTCGATCRQIASRAARAASRRADAWLAQALALEAVALPLVAAGELDGYDALALVVWPPERLRDTLRAAA